MFEGLKNSKFLEGLKKVKSMQYFIILLVLAIVLSLAGNIIDKGNKTGKESDSISNSEKTGDELKSAADDSQEARLKKVLAKIKGTGRVEVMITYKTGKEKVPAVSTVTSNTDTEERDSEGGVRKVAQKETNTQPVSVNTSNGSEALIVKEIEPEIQGVIVIAEGAADLKVRLALESAIQTVLGLDANQVEVFEMD